MMIYFPHAFFVLLALSTPTFISSAESTGLSSGFAEKSVPRAVASTEKSPCLSTYKRLYDRGVLELRMIFGYKDSRPARFVGDRHERVIFTQHLLRPCNGREEACGFSQSEENSDDFFKIIKGPEGEPIQVRVVVSNSSVSSDDEKNQVDKYQKWKSKETERLFLEGLVKADVVFYNGHSRNGGGPDFFPPLLTADGHVDYTYYERETPGLVKILKAFIDNNANIKSEKIQLLGLFSCASTKHFAEQIIEERPKLGLITSRQLIYYEYAIYNSLAALDSLLQMKCEKDFRSAIRSSSYQKGSQITGFF